MHIWLILFLIGIAISLWYQYCHDLTEEQRDLISMCWHDHPEGIKECRKICYRVTYWTHFSTLFFFGNKEELYDEWIRELIGWK